MRNMKIMLRLYIKLASARQHQIRLKVGTSCTAPYWTVRDTAGYITACLLGGSFVEGCVGIEIKGGKFNQITDTTRV